jgi:hypothetical protein
LFLFSHVSEERKVDILKKFESLSQAIRIISTKDLSLLGSPIFEEAVPIFSQKFGKNSTY